MVLCCSDVCSAPLRFGDWHHKLGCGYDLCCQHRRELSEKEKDEQQASDAQYIEVTSEAQISANSAEFSDYLRNAQLLYEAPSAEGMFGEDDGPPDADGNDSDSDSDEDGDELIRMAKRIEAADDSNYFDSYSFIEIHETMLKDKARTEAYRDAMLANRALFEGATVIDVGCGTGILSIFAVRNPNPLAVFEKTPPLHELLVVGAPWLPSIILLARALLVVGA